ncbi:MAG: prepilin peptidase [Tissierellia bacterium]|nr:prepilin peptidase [Tissierellia bacterium]
MEIILLSLFVILYIFINETLFYYHEDKEQGKAEIVKSIKKIKFDRGFLVRGIISIVLGVALITFYHLGKMDLSTVLKYIILFITLVYISYTDIKSFIIPNIFLILLLFFRIPSLVIDFFNYEILQVLKFYLLGGLTGFGILLLVYLVTRKGLGEGDVKLYSVIGLYVGLHAVIPILAVSSVLTAAFGLLIIMLKKANLKTVIPLGPFLAMGTIFTTLMVYLRGGIL